MSKRLPPSQRPHRREKEADIYIGTAPKEKPILLTHVTVEDLIPYVPQIRMTYWEGVMKGGYQDPFVFVIHRMSAYAKRNGLEKSVEPLRFHSVTRDGAVKMGLIQADKMPEPTKPPLYMVILATGDDVQTHLVLNLSPTGVIDMIRSDPSCRARLEAENPDLGPVLRDYPGMLTDWRH